MTILHNYKTLRGVFGLITVGLFQRLQSTHCDKRDNLDHFIKPVNNGDLIELEKNKNPKGIEIQP